MKVSGYKLREAIKQYELRRDTSAAMFEDTLKKFPNEEKASPQTVVVAYQEAEIAVAKLMTAQMVYNLAISVDVLGEKMTLAEAIKRVGGAGRLEKMWRSAASGKRKDRYYSETDTLDLNQIRAVTTIDSTVAVELATKAGRVSGAFRAVIATANAQEVEIEGLSPALFELV